MTARVCTRCGNDVPERFAPELTVCFDCRLADVLSADQEFDACQWFLFFTGSDGALLGGCVVEAQGMLTAVTVAHELGINPGGEVQGLPVSDDNQGLLPVNVFLTPDDLAEPPPGWVS